jgi:hypothetical protein
MKSSWMALNVGRRLTISESLYATILELYIDEVSTSATSTRFSNISPVSRLAYCVVKLQVRCSVQYNISKEQNVLHQTQQLYCDRRMLGLLYLKAVDSIELGNHYRLQNVSESTIPTMYVHVLRDKQPVCAFQCNGGLLETCSFLYRLTEHCIY